MDPVTNLSRDVLSFVHMSLTTDQESMKQKLQEILTVISAVF